MDRAQEIEPMVVVGEVKVNEREEEPTVIVVEVNRGIKKVVVFGCCGLNLHSGGLSLSGEDSLGLGLGILFCLQLCFVIRKKIIFF